MYNIVIKLGTVVQKPSSVSLSTFTHTQNDPAKLRGRHDMKFSGVSKS